jgi:hypothetical protein
MTPRVFLLAFLGASLAAYAPAQDAAIAESLLHPWQMRNANAARTGQSPAVGATLGELDWRFHVAGRVPQIAVAQDGSIFLGTVFNENDWNNESYAYALTSTGTLKWRRKVTSSAWSGAQGTKGGPAVDDGGNVLVPSSYTQLLKLTGDGDELWLHQGNPGAFSQGSPAVLSDQSVRHTIFPNGTPNGGLVGLDAVGTLLFTGSAYNPGATVAVAANGEMALGGLRTNEPHGSKNIQYFNADGTLRWEELSATYGAQGTPVIGPDGVVYAPFLGKAYLPDGTVKWTTNVRSATVALGDNGVLYFPSDGVVAVLAATGAQLWNVPIPGGVFEETAVDALGNVFVTTADGKLWSISPTGGVNWSLQVCDTFLTGPVIAAGGKVVAAGQTGFQKFVFAVR